MQFEKLGCVELGRLQNLRLADVDVLEREDALAGLLDLTTDGLRCELLDELLEIDRRRLAGHDLMHLLPDFADLAGLRVGGLADLVGPALGECNGEQADEVAVGGLDIDVRLDERLPLADERPKLVRGEIHAVEVGQAALALDVVNPELDLAESRVLVLVEVAQRDLKDTALERIACVLCA